MEYVEYLNRGAKLVHEQVIRAGYEILENSPLCLMTTKTLALHDGKNKRIYICTGSLKSILLWNSPQSPRDKLTKTIKKDSTYFISKALTHEAVHAAQYCNGGKIIAPHKASQLVNEWKKEAIDLSLMIGGTEAREEEAYLLETDPFYVADAIEKFCF